MALNSNLVINRLGFTPGDANGESPEVRHNTDATYTASRLGLTLVKLGQPVGSVETSVPMPAEPHDGEALDSRLGISTGSELAQSRTAVRKPFWPRFRNAVSLLAIAVKKGILGKLTPRQRATAHHEASHAFISHPVESPAPKTADNGPPTVYRKGTFKMPSGLLARLKACAAANHKYQYRLVIESLDESLTAKGFTAEAEVDTNSEG
ncbi:MAG: hypothetical protein QGH60_10220 [Phycisphaerae bacterium]|jgi:hypothetical protein|nr:hypothetical protein [Phycisphaerae bacterium]